MTAVPGTGLGAPPYRVHRSRRARRVLLRVTARDGLVVTVPEHMRQDEIASLLESRQAWIDTALARVAERRALHLAGAEAMLPSDIDLRATGERVRVEYRCGAGPAVRAREREGTLELRGDIDDADACLAALRRWLARAARERLTAELVRLWEAHGASPRRVRVAAQKTRWGSYSATGTVSLNRNLVFLPSELVRAVMLHELAHTRVLDHSTRFWRQLERLDPDARMHRARLREAADLVPVWADA